MAVTDVFSTGDAMGHDALAPVLSAHVDNIDLPANTAVTVTVPASAAFALFSAAADFWCRRGGTAAVPAAGGGSVVTGEGSVLNPAARRVPVGNIGTLSLISATAQVISIEWYKRGVS